MSRELEEIRKIKNSLDSIWFILFILIVVQCNGDNDQERELKKINDTINRAALQYEFDNMIKEINYESKQER
jgi:hypothetical protein